jgi:LPXTG-motif cell wall-anchored protein
VTKEIQSFAYEPEEKPAKINSTFFDNASAAARKLYSAVQTGDGFILWLWIGLMVFGIIGIFSLILMRRTRKGERSRG